ncbi:MAG: FIST C-terminal domain-containing protein [Synergistaceae bacterium]|jgi:small ligand-binding sensory domain FIST|nr:FIST C-terminal domain-containing protein [Synergistaceae bacterium]
MYAGVGYSDNPDSAAAGRQAATEALEQAGRDDPCDLVLLYATARHDAQALRDAVTSVTGAASVVGGGAVGIITNDRFGYAGDQVGTACLWLKEAHCDILTEGGLLGDEQEAGRHLGERLSSMGVTKTSPLMLFYDAIDRTGGGMRLVMATRLLAGMEEGLGFLPDLTGAGMQGDYACTPTRQWLGETVGEHHAMMLAFSGNIRIDNVIMHGCRPATRYYTVTKADGQTILEINGQPALSFLDGLLNSAISPESYPFFLILGVNRGDKWGKFDENNYASRLCLAIDKQRQGIVMFEPDMVEGTEFQIMCRSFDLQYMQPQIEELFSRIKGREPVFALYIDCAGRAAGYGGIDMEDAVMVQKIVANRVPLLGMYTGVEIAPIGGRPRGLDWTGVFCLFSVAR